MLLFDEITLANAGGMKEHHNPIPMLLFGAPPRPNDPTKTVGTQPPGGPRGPTAEGWGLPEGTRHTFGEASKKVLGRSRSQEIPGATSGASKGVQGPLGPGTPRTVQSPPKDCRAPWIRGRRRVSGAPRPGGPRVVRTARRAESTGGNLMYPVGRL